MTMTPSTPAQPASRSYKYVESLIAARRWDDAVAVARELGAAALQAGDYGLARRTGALLDRLTDHRTSAHLISKSLRALGGASPLPEWNGEDLRAHTLLIVSRNQHIGANIRFSRLLGLAAARARKCIAFAEVRLVPLLRRTFPGLNIWPAGERDTDTYSKACAEADIMAGFETLIEHLGTDDAGRIVALPLLQPDPNEVADFRRRYDNGLPLVGLGWHSTNDSKDLPALADWVTSFRRLNVTPVSVQYGDVGAHIEAFRRAGVAIVNDASVDSLVDIDRFAAQVRALDAVVTISNTGAHMAGAVGVPTFILLDDKNHLTWPLVGRSTGWYPSVTLHRRAGRPWAGVFSEIESELLKCSFRPLGFS